MCLNSWNTHLWKIHRPAFYESWSGSQSADSVSLISRLHSLQPVSRLACISIYVWSCETFINKLIGKYIYIHCFIEILTTRQQWLKIHKKSAACWTPSSVLAWPLVSWDVDCLKSSEALRSFISYMYIYINYDNALQLVSFYQDESGIN